MYFSSIGCWLSVGELSVAVCSVLKCFLCVVFRSGADAAAPGGLQVPSLLADAVAGGGGGGLAGHVQRPRHSATQTDPQHGRDDGHVRGCPLRLRSLHQPPRVVPPHAADTVLTSGCLSTQR